MPFSPFSIFEYATLGYVTQLNPDVQPKADRCPKLRALYLEPRNAHIRNRLYITPCSSNTLVRTTIAYQLATAARTELLKGLSLTDIKELYLEAENAFAALSTLLGDDQWFFGVDRPSLFDASVFAYTHLLLDREMGWQEGEELVRSVRRRANLVRHRDGVLRMYYGGERGRSSVD